MIHFDFTVTEEEAEVIMNAIHQQIIECNRDVATCFGPENTAMCEARLEALKEVSKKMSNTQV